MLRLVAVAALVSLSILGCSSAPPPPDTDASIVCTEDAQCDDGLFCNGVERCMPFLAGASARGCAPAADTSPCLEGQVCDEDGRECDPDCDVAPDADGDGERAIGCMGGNDCDDSDPLRYPGNVEICDEGNHDEDCDDTTYGERNGDRDGADDLRCCNVRDDDPTMLNCGEDCDDLRRVVNPDTTEACDRFDNDCDGAIDEGVFVEVFADLDRDGVGAGPPTMRCADAVGFALEGDDCDDMDPSQRPRGPEICDGRDNDCDDDVDEDATAVTWYRDADGDGFGSARTGSVISCEPISGFTLLGNDCDDTRSGVSPVANELCNGRDDDCNGVADFEVRPGDFEDDDADGFVDSGCGALGDDCDDTSATTHPGATEICDGRDNDCDEVGDDLTGMIAWYPDLDGDGWGDSAGAPITSCTEPAGRVGRALDCDDSDPDRHPGQADLCDGEEEDCDDEIDEDAPTTPYWMGDRDGDGYAGGTPVQSCMPVPGASPIGGDCDDDRADLRPGASELCDGEDDDCDGATDEGLGMITCGMVECTTTVPACSGGAPQVCTPSAGAPEICNGRDDDCDGMIDDEPSATTSCALAGAIDQCTGGACSVVACDAGRADCNGADPDGCEAVLADDEANCGACGHACAPGATCTFGGCTGEWVELALGSRHSCVRSASGEVLCWGANDRDQLGRNSAMTFPTFPRPVAVLFDPGAGIGTSVVDATAIDASLESTCVIRRGSLRPVCWGERVPAGTNSIYPTAFWAFENNAIVRQPVEIEFGGSFHLVRDETGRLWFAGSNAEGAQGTGGTGGAVTGYGAAATPTLIAVSDVECGIAHCLARDGSSATQTYAWGHNYDGQLGGIYGGASSVPVAGAFGAWIHAAAGQQHTCLVRPDGTIACAGQNARGQIGNGTTTATAGMYLTVTGVRGDLGIDTHSHTTCAIDDVGRVHCWGANDFGQCGTAGPADVLTPVQVPLGGVRAREIAVGQRHACAILITNQIVCWGQGSFGQLGDGSMTPTSPTPVFVTGLP